MLANSILSSLERDLSVTLTAHTVLKKQIDIGHDIIKSARVKYHGPLAVTYQVAF